MRVNSISTYIPQRQNISFGHTAVPYPEYEKAYYKNEGSNIVDAFSLKLASIFNPQIKKAASDIKTEINGLYPDTKAQNKVQNKKALSLYA